MQPQGPPPVGRPHLQMEGGDGQDRQAALCITIKVAMLAKRPKLLTQGSNAHTRGAHLPGVSRSAFEPHHMPTRSHVHTPSMCGRGHVCAPWGVCTAQRWGGCHGVYTAGGDARSAPDRVCASRGVRTERGWGVRPGAAYTAVCGCAAVCACVPMCGRLCALPPWFGPAGHLCPPPPLARRSVMLLTARSLPAGERVVGLRRAEAECGGVGQRIRACPYRAPPRHLGRSGVRLR
jgi:hypothetical protein